MEEWRRFAKCINWVIKAEWVLCRTRGHSISSGWVLKNPDLWLAQGAHWSQRALVSELIVVLTLLRWKRIARFFLLWGQETLPLLLISSLLFGIYGLLLYIRSIRNHGHRSFSLSCSHHELSHFWHLCLLPIARTICLYPSQLMVLLLVKVRYELASVHWVVTIAVCEFLWDLRELELLHVRFNRRRTLLLLELSKA